ncbi:hypothetical protein ACHWQZ_G002150 [Mnemiopsis leidyi]
MLTNPRVSLTLNFCCRALAGHAHWQNVAKVKGANDAKKSKLLTAWIPKLRTAAKVDSNLERNKSLQKLVDQAKKEGVPPTAIKNAITAWDNQDFKEHQFGIQGKEGFIALIDCATSSVKKTENDIQTLLRRHNFKYSSVGFMFSKFKDLECQLPEKISKDEIEELALQCGTEEYHVDSEANKIVFSIDAEDEKELIGEVKNLELDIISNTYRYVAIESTSIVNSETKRRIGMFMKSLEGMSEVEDIHHNVENMDEIMNEA